MNTIKTDEYILQILPRKYCWSMSNHSLRILHIIEKIDGLTDLQRSTLAARFISITEDMKKRMIFYACVFHIGRFTVTGGSLIVPALLSIQTPNGVSDSIFWITWALSLMVTLSNAILTLFKVEKKYYYIHTCIEQLYSEMWQYIEMTGRYSGYLLKGSDDIYPTHANQFIFVCHYIEKIKIKQIEEEYFKVQEAQNQTNDIESRQKPNFNIITPDLKVLAKHRDELESNQNTIISISPNTLIKSSSLINEIPLTNQNPLTNQSPLSNPFPNPLTTDKE